MITIQAFKEVYRGVEFDESHETISGPVVKLETDSMDNIFDILPSFWEKDWEWVVIVFGRYQLTLFEGHGIYQKVIA